MTRVRYAWGIYDKDGALKFVSLDETEHAAWYIYLGWPDQSEIDNAKRRGLQCIKVAVAPL